MFKPTADKQLLAHCEFDYIYGQEVGGERFYPSIASLSQQYGIPKRTLERYSSQRQWKSKREIAQKTKATVPPPNVPPDATYFTPTPSIQKYQLTPQDISKLSEGEPLLLEDGALEIKLNAVIYRSLKAANAFEAAAVNQLYADLKEKKYCRDILKLSTVCRNVAEIKSMLLGKEFIERNSLGATIVEADRHDKEAVLAILRQLPTVEEIEAWTESSKEQMAKTEPAPADEPTETALPSVGI